jgi:hypothetical protein
METPGSCALRCDVDHLTRQIGCHHSTAGLHCSRRGERRITSAARHVEQA